GDRGGGLDVRALHAVEVLTFDAYQLCEAGPLRRVDRADIVEVAVAGLHQVRPSRLNQARRVAVAAFDDAPVGHFRRANSDGVDRPAWAMVVRRPVRDIAIDVATNAKAQLWILVQHLARATLIRGQVLGDEVLIKQGLRYEGAHRLFAGGSRIGLKGP